MSREVKLPLYVLGAGGKVFDKDKILLSDYINLKKLTF